MERVERSHKDLRIVRVWARDGDLYIGIHGNAPVERGEAACQLSNGQKIELAG